MADGFARIDEHFAQNLREFREAAGISQEELAHRMTELGFGFSQATIWKIEQNKRPVRIGEAAAFHQALEVPPWRSLEDDPMQFKHGVNLDLFNRAAYDAHIRLKEAARGYLDAQMQLTFAVHEANKAGFTVPDSRKSWLTTPVEEVAITARIESEHEDEHGEQISVAVRKVVGSLREQGYEPIFDPADITEHPPETPPSQEP